MSTGAIEFLLGTLFWLTVMTSIYAAVLFAADALMEAARQRRHARQRLREELARIDHEAQASVLRIAGAFETARRELNRAGANEVQRS
ncbi:hypothetical protein ACXPWS_05020 [Mycobacterium sp. BMJ-28]